MSADRWTVQYGGDNDDGAEEWWTEESFDVESVAREFFARIVEERPSQGAWPLDFVNLSNPAGQIVSFWSSEEEDKS